MKGLDRLLAIVLVLAPALCLAQEEIDAPYRVYDSIYLEGVSEPVVGTIVEQNSTELTIRKQGSNITFTKRKDEIARVVVRETPETAYRTRAKRLGQAGEPALHRRLGEWCLEHSLIPEAERQVSLAAKLESDPQIALGHRERLVELLLERFPTDAEDDGAPALFEQLLGITGAAGEADTSSPLLNLAQARVAISIGLPEQATAPLERARDALEALASGPPPADEVDPDPSPTPQATPSPSDDPGPRYGRDGERLDPRGPRWDDTPRGGRDGGDVEPTDNSAEVIPGLAQRWHALFEEVYRTLGRLHADQGRASQAERCYARLLEVWPEHALASIGLARLQIANGEPAAAVQTLSTAIQAAPDDPRLLLTRGQLHYLDRQLDQARADLLAAQASLVDAVESRLNRRVGTALGLVETCAGRFELAQGHFQAADQDPGYGPARLGLGLLAECSGDRATARQHYDEALRLFGPRAGEVDYALAWLLAESGDATGAERELKRAVQGGFDLRLALGSMLELAQRRGDGLLVSRAVEALYRADPDPQQNVLAGLGRSYIEQGRLDEARLVFRRALKQDPDHLPALRGLAYCAYAKDEREQAEQLFVRILELRPDDTWAQAGKRNLHEAQTRRFWADAFEQTQIDASWRERVDYGVKVSQRDGRLHFRGTQANSATGKTMLTRQVKGERLVRLEASFDMDKGNVRAGLRWQASRGPTVVLFHDFDGKVRFSYQRSSRSGWEDPVELCEWPGSGTHVLAIDVVDPARGSLEFQVDGQKVGELRVPAKGAKESTVGLYAQGRELGKRVTVSVDEVRLYVHRESKRGRGDGF